jgi:hypothetical protein
MWRILITVKSSSGPTGPAAPPVPPLGPNDPTGPTTFLPDCFGKIVDRSVIRGPFRKIEIAERLA